MEIEENHFWGARDQFQNSTELNTEHENTCSFSSHVGSSYISGNVLPFNCMKKKFSTISCIKFLYKFFLFLIFLIYNTLTGKLNGNTLDEKIVIFFQWENFVYKTTFHFHSFDKTNDFITIQDATTIFYLFYLNP